VVLDCDDITRQINQNGFTTHAAATVIMVTIVQSRISREN